MVGRRRNDIERTVPLHRSFSLCSLPLWYVGQLQPQQLGAESRGHTSVIGLVHSPSELSLYQLRSNLFITARARPRAVLAA